MREVPLLARGFREIRQGGGERVTSPMQPQLGIQATYVFAPDRVA